jgi:hypothetical protein
MYPKNSDLKIIVHLFKNLYAEDNLTMEVLKGKDAHTVSHVRSIAAELGYVVAFANLKYKLIGRAETGKDDDDDDDGKERKAGGEGAGDEGTDGIGGESGDDADGDGGEDGDDLDWEGEDVDKNDDVDEDQQASMGEITGRVLSISNLVDPDGVQNLKVGQLFLEDENLIQKYPFDDNPPDETEYDGPVSLLHCFNHLD